jgi:DNA modification methylase
MLGAKQIKWEAVDKLIPYAKNARTHSDEQVAQIAGSIKEFGFNNPILVDKGNSVIAGHGRLMAARKLGMDKVPIVELEHLTESQRKAYVLADNRIALNSGWDTSMLSLELQDLKDDIDLSLLGFDPDELDALLNPIEETEGLTDEDAVPDVPDEPKTKLGDIYILGNHRLMCGDSTSIDDVEDLVDGVTIDMVYTDPPYGISHSGKGITANGVEGNNFGEILGDDDISIAIDSFNLCQSLYPNAFHIFWGANYYASCLINGYGWIVWDKQREGNTFSGAELAYVNKGVRVDVFRHMWHGMVKASEHGQKRVHPTQKPTALSKWCFDNYGKPQTVLDLFGGSGSTLIACEETNKNCLMMELDPKYCDVIVKRWENFTGKKAELVELSELEKE